MKKLWTFGDSYTELFRNQTGTLKDYCGWKQEIPLTFSESICKKMNYELKSCGKGGASNRTILSQFVNVLNEINQEDILIFGWTNLARFRIVTENAEIHDIIGPLFKDDIPPHPSFSIKSVEETIIMRSDHIFFTELIEYISMIKKMFPENKIINWTWHNVTPVEIGEPKFIERNKISKKFYENIIHFNYGEMEKIVDETNGQIVDYHYSENSHNFLADKFIEKINEL
jgi:hypothetical protein